MPMYRKLEIWILVLLLGITTTCASQTFVRIPESKARIGAILIERGIGAQRKVDSLTVQLKVYQDLVDTLKSRIINEQDNSSNLLSQLNLYTAEVGNLQKQIVDYKKEVAFYKRKYRGQRTKTVITFLGALTGGFLVGKAVYH